MSSNGLLEVWENLSKPRIMVLGDLMLDRYTWGNAERISQEAPVVVLRADRRKAQPGGAANVANMLAVLESRVTCCGVVGGDVAGDDLMQLLINAGVDCEMVLRDAQRATSVKERFVGRASGRHPSQILRVDHETCDPLCGALEARLVEKIAAAMPHHDAVLISDYGKGVCTPWLLKTTIEAAQRAGIPVMVDPSRTAPFSYYRGVTMIKPNRIEAELATGRQIAATADALLAGRQLCQDLAAKMALITLDRDGMMLVKHDGTGEIFSTRARAVYDITGAGDMVMAMIGLCMAAGVNPADAVRLGNVAAGLEVERAGVAVVRRDEIRAELMTGRGAAAQKVISREQAARLAEDYRGRGDKVVFTNGCFDLLHVGHVSHLAEAALLGNALFVGVNSDQSVRRLKGAQRPVVGQHDRAAMLAAMACVQHVVIFDEDTPHALLEAIRPDVLVKGGTYQPHEVVGHEVVEAYGGIVRVTGAIKGVSTTEILAAATRGHSPHASQAPLDAPPSIPATPQTLIRVAQPPSEERSSMKILHVTTWKIRCGIAACTESLVEQLDQRGVESTVFPITPSSVHTMVQNDVSAMIEKIAEQARECDLVHIQHEYGFFASPSIVNSIRNFGHLLRALKKVGRPVVVTFHTTRRFPLTPPTSKQDLANLVLNRMWRWLVARHFRGGRGACHALTHNPQGRQALVNGGFDDRNVSIVSMGHSQRPVDLSPEKKLSAKSTLGLPADSVLLSMFGFIGAYKGYAHAVRALKLLPKNYILAVIGGRHPDARSDRTLNNMLRAWRKQDPKRLIITGYADRETIDLYQTATDICLAPYLPEFNVSASAALTWALTSGRPTIASGIGVFEEINRRSQCLLTVTPEVHHELAWAIERLAHDQPMQARLVQNAQSHARTNSWMVAADQNLNVYEQVLSQTKGPRRRVAQPASPLTIVPPPKALDGAPQLPPAATKPNVAA